MTDNTNSAYQKAGVDYSSVDPIKVLAQKAAGATAKNLSGHSAQEMSFSRGESAYVWDEGDKYGAFVIEGLGTKNLIADKLHSITDKTYYDQLAKDTVAMIVNDLVVVGALPKVINAYFAVGDSKWMEDMGRAEDLINGWAAACDEAGAAWGGGETPVLKDIVESSTIELAGSAVGEVKDKANLVTGEKLAAGDAIVLVESSGIHANGLTLVRSMADKEPGIYEEKLSDGRLFGEALLEPTHIYVGLVKELQKELDLHYMVNITGHGWRKLMRAVRPFSYEITQVPEAQAEFKFIQEKTQTSDEQMYATFNMGAGFALMLPADQADKAVEAAKALGLKAWLAGEVKEGPKQVIIKPKNITFSADSLEVR